MSPPLPFAFAGSSAFTGRANDVLHKCAPPFTEAEFEIRYGTGVDTCAELMDVGLAHGLVEKSRNLAFGGTTLGNGGEKSRDALVQSDAEGVNEANPELEKALLRRLEGGPLHTWQLGGSSDVVLALYRLRKAGLVTYHRDHQLWRLR